MAVYRDIDSDVRINGSLSLPSGSITAGTNINAKGQLQINGVDITTLFDKYSGWKLSANTEATPVSISSGSTVDFKAGTNVTVTRSGNTITIASTDTNTWRPIDTTPVDGSANSITSNWAFDHAALKGIGAHVPNTVSGDEAKFLRGDGTWATVSTTDTNYYLSSVTGNGNSSNVTFTLSNGGTVTWNAVHTHTEYLGTSGTAADSSKLGGVAAANYLRNDTNGTINGVLTVGNAAQALSLKGGASDQVYIGFYPDAESQTTRWGWIGYGSSATTTMHIANEQGNVVLSPKASTGKAYVGSYEIWHAGNMGTSNFVLSTETGQKVKDNFSVLGRMWAGDDTITGSIVIKGNTVGDGIQNAIQFGGNTALSNIKAFISETGAAKFNGTVQVANLSIDTTSMVKNLNAEFIGGSKETEFVRTPSVRDIHGYGILRGMDITQKSPTPDMTVTVKAGVAYTDSGRRFEYNDTSVPITTASANWDRYDIIYIRGREGGANEGTINVRTGAATQTPVIEYSALATESPGSIVVGIVHVRANIGTITDGSSGSFDAIDVSPRKLMSLRLVEGSTYSINEALSVGGKITEAGVLLESKYARLASSNKFTGDQDITGFVKITHSGTVGGVTSGSVGLKITNGSNSLAMDSNEIVCDTTLYVKSTEVLNLTGTAVDLIGKVKASNSVKTLTIAAGQTSVTWTHNYGASTYVVNLSSNSFARHVRWTSKANNTIVVEIDDPHTEDILVDCMLIGY